MKMNKKSAAPPSAASPCCEVAPAEIALSAYSIWEQEGRPEGRDLEHWLQAEARLKRGCSQDAVQQ